MRSGARCAALRGHDVIVAEKEAQIGTGISSRNSEVIHAGIYYPTGSLRARHCVRGRRMLYDYCASHGIPHKKYGKLIVATRDAEIAKMEALLGQALANGVEGDAHHRGCGSKAMEPALACVAALHSPQTGIIDSHRLMRSCRAISRIAAARSRCVRQSPSLRARRRLEVRYGGAEPGALIVDAVVNAAGLGAQALARDRALSAGAGAQAGARQGQLFPIRRPAGVSRLIYPAPVEGGLGTHVTLDLAGRMRFGPDVEWIETESYGVDQRRADSFYASIRTYFPALPDGALMPDYCSIRPKITGRGEPAADFLIDGPAEHGLPGLVSCSGSSRPASPRRLSIAEDVLERLG